MAQAGGLARLYVSLTTTYNKLCKLPVARQEKPRLAWKPKILVLDPHHNSNRQFVQRLSDVYEVVEANSVVRGLALLRDGGFAGVFAATADLRLAEQVGVLLQADQILEAIADGVALVDTELNILWANPEFLTLAGKTTVVGTN